MADNEKKENGKAEENLEKQAARQDSEKKKNRGDQKKNAQGKKKGGIIAYFKGVRQEMSKVVWPTREELTTDTIVVFICVAFFALSFWLIDTGFLAALKGVLGITLS